MSDNDKYDFPATQAMLLTNTYSAIIAQIAMNLNKEAGGHADPLKNGNFNKFIDEADKLVMNVKTRLLENNLQPEHKHLLGLLK